MTGKWIHGMLCSIWQWAAKRNDHLFRQDADFSGWLSPGEAGFSEEQGNQYQPSTDALVKVLKRFPISEVDAVLDIGCGKGKAMYLMNRLPFGKIRGYDLSGGLVRIANENFKKLGLKKCRAVQADAASFDDYDDFNYFYIFNSFPQKVFEIMMGHILESVRRNPRKVRFIYLHPVCHDYIVKQTPFHLVYRRKSVISWFDYYCYEN